MSKISIIALLWAVYHVQAFAQVLDANSSRSSTGDKTVTVSGLNTLNGTANCRISNQNETMNVTLTAWNGTLNCSLQFVNSTASNDSQISWPSVAWSLIALGLNAQTQRSPADHFPSSDSLSPARSSPLICVADVLLGILWMVRGMKSGLSPTAAAKWYRKESRLSRENSDRKLVQGTPAVALIFFGLGPLPQALKLFGAKGLGWTKVWASMLVAGFLFEVILRIIAGLPENSGVRAPDESLLRREARKLYWYSKIAYTCAYSIQLLLWVWVIFVIAVVPLVIWISAFFFFSAAWFAFYVFASTGLLYAILQVLLLIPQCARKKSRCETLMILFTLPFGALGIAPLIWRDTPFFKSIFAYLGTIRKPFGLVTAVFGIIGSVWSVVAACGMILFGLDVLLVTLGDGDLDRPLQHSEDVRYLPLGQGEQGSSMTAETVEDAPNHESSPFSLALDHFQQSSKTFVIFVGKHFRKVWDTSPRLRRTAMWIGEHSLISIVLEDDDIRRRVMPIVFSLGNILFTTLYYMMIYDPTGTEKPQWSEMLG